jgi:hypothetical protein
VIRILLAAWFSLLLVGMQQQVVVHEVDHLRAKIQRGHFAALVNPTGGECLECALLVAGTNAAPTADVPTLFDVAAATPIVAQLALGVAQAAPAFYRSRAPPILP